MKILDRYVAKNFMIGYAIAFGVLMGLRIIIDLFVGMDEFTEKPDMETMDIIRHILSYYAINSTLYFRDFAGMITVVAAVFSLGRMIKSNELVAIMASGISLKRIIAPIIVLSILLTGLLVVDQELIIPSFADKLSRDKDDVPGQESYDVWFIGDNNGSLINSRRFNVEKATLENPTIILRKQKPGTNYLVVTGWIDSESATYNSESKRWDLAGGVLNSRDDISQKHKPIESYSTNITAKDIPVRRKSRNKSLLSWSQLSTLASNRSQIRDIAQLYSQMHFHITDPVINLVMLMVALPVLVCRDPKTTKTAVMKGFTFTSLCFVFTFLCKMLATEVVFNQIRPELWAWLPVFVFLPLAFIQIDSMKT